MLNLSIEKDIEGHYDEKPVGSDYDNEVEIINIRNAAGLELETINVQSRSSENEPIFQQAQAEYKKPVNKCYMVYHNQKAVAKKN